MDFNLLFHKRKKNIFLVVILLICLLPSPVFAVTKFNVKPKIAVGWQTDSNYYKDNKIGEREVHTSYAWPGIEIGFQTSKTKIDLDYTFKSEDYSYEDPVKSFMESVMLDDFVDYLNEEGVSVDKDDFEYYDEWQEERDVGNFRGHNLVFRARTKPFTRLTIGIDNTYQKTRDTAFLDNFGLAVEKEEYSINRFTPVIHYRFGQKFEARLRYTNTRTNYDRVGFDDSDEDRGAFNLIYNLNRNMSLDVEYQLWKRDYDMDSSDYESDQTNLVFRMNMNHINLEAGCGFHDRDFDENYLEDIDMFNYIFTLKWQHPSGADRGNIRFMSQRPATRVSGYALPTAIDMPKTYFILAFKENFNDAGEGDNYFEALQATAQAGHLFFDKIAVNLELNWQHSDYETRYGVTPAGALVLREDDIYRYAGNIGYLILDWLSFDITAGYEERDSNLFGHDYENTYVMFKIDAEYDLRSR